MWYTLITNQIVDQVNTQGTNSQNTVYLTHKKNHLLSDIGEYVDVAELCYKSSICSAVHQYSICIRHMSPQSPGRWWMIHFKQPGWYYMTVTFLSLLFDSKINEEKWARIGIWLKVSFSGQMWTILSSRGSMPSFALELVICKSTMRSEFGSRWVASAIPVTRSMQSSIPRCVADPYPPRQH